MSRKTARKQIMNILFQTKFNTEDTLDLDSIISTYCEEVEPIEEGDMPFVAGQLKGIIDNRASLEDMINKYATGWTVDRMNKIDVAILELAIYEILYCEDIPDRVSASEAVELASEYSLEKAPRFINGILGKIIKEKVN